MLHNIRLTLCGTGWMLLPIAGAALETPCLGSYIFTAAIIACLAAGIGLDGKKKAAGNGNSHTAQSKTIQLQYIPLQGKRQGEKYGIQKIIT